MWQSLLGILQRSERYIDSKSHSNDFSPAGSFPRAPRASDPTRGDTAVSFSLVERRMFIIERRPPSLADAPRSSSDGGGDYSPAEATPTVALISLDHIRKSASIFQRHSSQVCRVE